jgi:ribosome maturation factor RimP
MRTVRSGYADSAEWICGQCGVDMRTVRSGDTHSLCLLCSCAETKTHHETTGSVTKQQGRSRNNVVGHETTWSVTNNKIGHEQQDQSRNNGGAGMKNMDAGMKNMDAGMNNMGAGMKSSATLCADVANRIRVFIQQTGCMLVAVQYVQEDGSDVLRVLIDRDGGIDIPICERVSEHVGALLDDHPELQHAYVLEVTSPGVERPLPTADDVRSAIGRFVCIVTAQPVRNRMEWEGRLESFDGHVLTLRQSPRHKPLLIPYELVTAARLAVDFHAAPS